ncbi:MAG: hypothetical protein JNL74_11460 [Fibrobacteres bacterium]|nr:hypothetical protein [Fibrobacterota bacterium]
MAGFIFCILMYFSYTIAGELDAEAELLKIYGADTGAVQNSEWRNEFTSISRFVSVASAVKEQPLMIVYLSADGEESARILHSFFYRKRTAGLGRKINGADQARVYVVDADVIKANPTLLYDYKSVIIGRISDFQFFKRMATRGKLKAAKNRAQFHLFANPNSLAIVSESPKMFTELARVFVKNWKEFDDEVYSYFYLE